MLELLSSDIIDRAMSSNTTPPNSTEQLHRWRVMEAVLSGDIRTRHVCAENSANSYGISTSSIQMFDPVAMTVKTRSGKIYHLIGQPEKSPLGEVAWRQWCSENDIVAEHDVTGEFLRVDQTPTVTFKKIGFRYDVTTTF